MKKLKKTQKKENINTELEKKPQKNIFSIFNKKTSNQTKSGAELAKEFEMWKKRKSSQKSNTNNPLKESEAQEPKKKSEGFLGFNLNKLFTKKSALEELEELDNKKIKNASKKIPKSIEEKPIEFSKTKNKSDRSTFLKNEIKNKSINGGQKNKEVVVKDSKKFGFKNLFKNNNSQGIDEEKAKSIKIDAQKIKEPEELKEEKNKKESKEKNQTETPNQEKKIETKFDLKKFFSFPKTNVNKQSAGEIFRKHYQPINKEKKKGLLKIYVLKAGISSEISQLSRRIFYLTLVINFFITCYFLYSIYNGLVMNLTDIVIVLLMQWTVLFAIIFLAIWMLFFLYIDIKIYQRGIEIEEVLPDYLQLTSANIRAGMTIDQALWYAVRPRFGVLANEIEIVAKQTMSGMKLEDALRQFGEKYDSPVLRRSINLLIEGLEAGGEVGDLLNKISLNIQQTKMLKREMAANVMTYAIFISVATMLISPMLFALSGQLLRIITEILGNIRTPTDGATSAFPLKITAVGLSSGDFTIFAITSLFVTSIFSAFIIATIQKGEVKAGINFIPMFVIVSLIIYFAASFLFNMLFGSLF